MKCCNKILKLQEGYSEIKGDYFYFKCDTCGKKGIGKDQKQAEVEFKKTQPNKQPPKTESKQKQSESLQLVPIPRDKTKALSWATDNMPMLVDQSAQFIDKPATERMIKKNIRYISNLSGKSWDKIWKASEGQDSINYALSEANYYAATLGEMGDLVPFGTTCEFIPNIECFEFALTTGKNAPFREIDIISIYENDQRELENENGNFKIKVTMGIPRGELIAVAVTAVRTDSGKIIGELYDLDRLLEKAKRHSPSYRQYLMDKEDFKRMEVEGKLKKDESERSYFDKKIIYTKDGKEKSFMKKIYEHDIVNPYDGPDRPEMMRKAAGKPFFKPYMKTRNAAAMADEWNEDDTLNDEISRDHAADNVLDKAMDQFGKSSLPVKDGEIVTDNKKEVDKNNGNIDKDINDL